MKITKRQLVRLIKENLGAEKQCVSDLHPAIVELRSKLSAGGTGGWISNYDDGYGYGGQDFVSMYMPDDILNTLGDPVVLTTPKINLVAGAGPEIIPGAIEGLKKLVIEIESKHPDVKFAWVSFTSKDPSLYDELFATDDSPNTGETKINFIAIYASFTDNLTIPSDAEPFTNLTYDMVKSKGLGWGGC
jgi:hypothetical protein